MQKDRTSQAILGLTPINGKACSELRGSLCFPLWSYATRKAIWEGFTRGTPAVEWKIECILFINQYIIISQGVIQQIMEMLLDVGACASKGCEA